MNWNCFFLGHELERMNIKIADGYPYFIDKCNRCENPTGFTLNFYEKGRIGNI